MRIYYKILKGGLWQQRHALGQGSPTILKPRPTSWVPSQVALAKEYHRDFSFSAVAVLSYFTFCNKLSNFFQLQILILVLIFGQRPWDYAPQTDGMLPSLVLYPGNGTSAWFQKEDMSLGKSFRGANQSSKHSRNGMSQREVHQSHITGCRVLTLLLWKQITSCPLAPQACKYLRTL